MVVGATRKVNEPMSFQAKVVFSIVIFLCGLTLLFAYLATDQSRNTNDSLNRSDCRSVFAAKVTDANAEQSDADNKTRKAQVLAQYYSGTDNQELFVDAVELGFEGLEEQYDATFKVNFFNDQYQTLIHAQETDTEKFDQMCAAGPKSAPQPPPYNAPPR